MEFPLSRKTTYINDQRLFPCGNCFYSYFIIHAWVKITCHTSGSMLLRNGLQEIDIETYANRTHNTLGCKMESERKFPKLKNMFMILYVQLNIYIN